MAADLYLEMPVGYVMTCLIANMKVDVIFVDRLIWIKIFYITWVPGWQWNRLFRKV